MNHELDDDDDENKASLPIYFFFFFYLKTHKNVSSHSLERTFFPFFFLFYKARAETTQILVFKGQKAEKGTKVGV